MYFPAGVSFVITWIAGRYNIFYTKVMDYDKECPYRARNEYCTHAIRLFQKLPDEDQASLVERARHIHRPRGTVLAEENSEIDAILIIRHGKVKTRRIDANGEEHILDVLHDGQAIWHGMFLEDHVYHYDVVAITDVALCLIERHDFIAVLSEHPSTALYLIEMLSTELQDANEKAYLLSLHDVDDRVGQFLLFRDARCIGKEIELKLDDIAASISLRPETVSRVITRFEKEGAVRRIGRGKLLVTDRQKLSALSHA